MGDEGEGGAPNTIIRWGQSRPQVYIRTQKNLAILRLGMVQIIMSWASERKITEANYTLRKIIIKK
jgi:hypothetical protein